LLELIGDGFYSLIIWISEKINQIRIRYGLNYWSFSGHIKSKIGNVNQYIDSYEKFMIREARIKKCTGVVCGHIHKPEIRHFGDMTYYNDGDWVENLTALVETKSGELKIVNWTQEFSPKNK